MKKFLLAISMLGEAALSPLHAAEMASQLWTSNRIAEAEARVGKRIVAATNAIPALGDYATVSNRAMSALQAHQPLTPATNYTDAVAAEFENGTRIAYEAQVADNAYGADMARTLGEDERYDVGDILRAATNAACAVVGTATNGLPEVIGRKQDALPYPTNAIPYAAISGAPSGGGQEWRVVNYDVEVDFVNYVTNGIAILTFINAGYAYDINVSTNGWPEGASMFVRGSFRAGATYTIPNDLRLIGYGTWPTNNFQSVWWRSGTNIFVNILVEE